MFSKPVRVSWSRAVKQFRSHIFVLCILAFVLLTGMHSALQNTLNDMRFSWVPRTASGNVVLVTIDSSSIEKIGVWPWPRRLHAELLDNLVSAEASDIVFDVDFSSPSNPTFDQAFVDALQRAEGSVVLPAFKQSLGNGDSGKTIYVNRPLPQFGKHAWSATANVAIEPDGIVRHYSYGETLDGGFLPSVGALLGGNFNRREQPFKIDFSIDAASLPTVSYVDVLHGNFATLKKLKHKKIIIGATAIELGDRFNVPNGHVVPGATLQALAIESILQGRALHSSSNIVTLGGLGVVMLLMVVLWRRVSASTRLTVLVGLAIAIELGAVFLQAKLPIVIDTSLWHVAIVAYLAVLAIDEVDFRGLMMSIAERRFHRIAMSLGDGLVCTDRNGLITVWNPGAIFLCSAALAALAVAMEKELARSRDGGPGVSLRAFGTAYLRFALTQPGLFRTAFAVPGDPDAAGSPAKSGRSGLNPFQLLGVALDRMVEGGMLPPERRPGAEYLAWSAVHGLAMLVLEGPLRRLTRAEAQRIGQRVLDMVEQGL